MTRGAFSMAELWEEEGEEGGCEQPPRMSHVRPSGERWLFNGGLPSEGQGGSGGKCERPEGKSVRENVEKEQR